MSRSTMPSVIIDLASHIPDGTLWPRQLDSDLADVAVLCRTGRKASGQPPR
jgi:hypothetical protein